MPEALEPPLLTSLAAVREFMQKTPADTSQDDDLENLILRASAAISRFAEREFWPTEAATRSFEYRPTTMISDIVNVAPYELRSVTKVLLDPEVNGGRELASEQWRLWPYPPRDGTFFGIRLNLLSIMPGTYMPFFTRRVDITGDWGMAAVPTEIQHWANVAVESWSHLRHDDAVGTHPNVEIGENEPAATPDDLPAAVRWAIRNRWLRPTFPR